MKLISYQRHSKLVPTAATLAVIGFAVLTSVRAQPVWGESPIREPYPYVSSGDFSGPAVPLSPDPLVAYRWPSPKADDGLEIYLQKANAATSDTSASFENLGSLTSDHADVTVRGTGSIRMDFGREHAAWLEFDSADLTGSVEMSISEYNEPCRTNAGYCKNWVKTLAPVKIGNTYRLELNDALYEGVRFGWIHVRSFTSPWHITGARLVCQVKPTNYNGSFSCSDPLLTKIWYACAYGIKINFNQDYFGAILIDRGDRFSWTGDAHPSQAASMVAFGNYDFVKKNLVNTSAKADFCPSYAMYYVLSLVDYYQYTGDAQALETLIPTATRRLDDAYARPDCDVVYYGWDDRLGAGTENANCQESKHALKMLRIRAWSEFAAVMKRIGQGDLYDKYRGYALARMAELRKDSAWYMNYGLHAAADAMNTGLMLPNESNALFEKQFRDRVNRVSISPFNQYFIIQAMSRMNRHDDALSSIRDLWGAQIRYGGSTSFETFRPSWVSALGSNDAIPNNQSGYSSLCHPWGGGVVKWLNEEVLGIKPTTPGFATYEILPHLGKTLSNVSGTTPTLHGEIRAAFDVATGDCTVSSPVGTTGTIGIPKAAKSITRISINGNIAWDGSYHAVAGIGGACQDPGFVRFSAVLPGTYRIKVSYSGTSPPYQEPPETYAGRFIKQDSSTQGNWGGVYGKEGYALCNYDGTSTPKVTTDRRSLPSYVSSLTYYMYGGEGKPNARLWAPGSGDVRALAPDSTNKSPRNAAGLYTADPQPCRNNMTFEVGIHGTHNYQIALYFVDWDNNGRRQAVEMMDAATLNLIAPVKVVKNFKDGAYLVYAYDKSVKFRIDQIRGNDATLSGIFFDPAPPTDAHDPAAAESKRQGSIDPNAKIGTTNGTNLTN